MIGARTFLFGAAAAAALAAGIGLGTTLFTARTPDARLEAGYVLDEPKQLPSFMLVDGEGAAFDAAGFRGTWSFLYFGYTYCPDVCPLSLIELAAIKRSLDSTYPDLEVRYYLVSVDPARDTPERVGEYVRYFDPEFRGLTGEAGEIDKLATAAFVVYSVPGDKGDGNYLVGHSSSFTLLDPNGRVYAVFTSPFDAGRIARDFGALVGG